MCPRLGISVSLTGESCRFRLDIGGAAIERHRAVRRTSPIGDDERCGARRWRAAAPSGRVAWPMSPRDGRHRGESSPGWPRDRSIFSASCRMSTCMSLPCVALYRPLKPSSSAERIDLEHIREVGRVLSGQELLQVLKEQLTGHVHAEHFFLQRAARPVREHRLAGVEHGLVEKRDDREERDSERLRRRSRCARASCSAVASTCLMRARNASASVATCLLARSRATVVNASCTATARRAASSGDRRAARRRASGAVASHVRNYDGTVTAEVAHTASGVDDDRQLELHVRNGVRDVDADFLRGDDRVPARAGALDGEVLCVRARRDLRGREGQVIERSPGNARLTSSSTNFSSRLWRAPERAPRARSAAATTERRGSTCAGPNERGSLTGAVYRFLRSACTSGIADRPGRRDDVEIRANVPVERVEARLGMIVVVRAAARADACRARRYRARRRAARAPRTVARGARASACR